MGAPYIYDISRLRVKIFTDGSKNEHGAGSGIAIYIQNKLTHQMEHKLHDRCSNNQAEQMATV